MILAPQTTSRALKRRLTIATLVGVFAVLVMAVGTASASANVYNVNDTSDNGDGTCDATCTLRDAIENSNSAGGDNTVNVPAGTYTLDYQINIATEGTINIVGAGARETIVDGQSGDRVFFIEGINVNISNLSIVNGDDVAYGAGIFNGSSATTTLTNVAVKNNQTAEDCYDAQSREYCYDGTYGAGIYNAGKLTINQSEISDNTANGGYYDAGYGGGIFNTGELHITNLTMNGNSAQNSNYDPPSAQGSYYEIPGVGGAIMEAPMYSASAAPRGNNNVTADIDTATIAGNTAGYGGGIAIGYLFAPDTAALEQFPFTMSLHNTIVADNTATAMQVEGVAKQANATDNCADAKAIIQSNGNNLGSDADNSCNLTQPSDQVGVNPLLGARANNGGPTDTMALQTGSPAIDRAGSCPPPSTDQRGVSRPQGPACDIGAYEVGVNPPPSSVAAAVQQSKPVASASASGPKSCVVSSARIRVSGKNIDKVTYSLDGKKIATKKGNKTSVKINAKHLKSGVHRVAAKVTYTGATGAKAQTKRITFSRCARKAVKPKFTG